MEELILSQDYGPDHGRLCQVIKAQTLWGERLAGGCCPASTPWSAFRSKRPKQSEFGIKSTYFMRVVASNHLSTHLVRRPWRDHESPRITP